MKRLSLHENMAIIVSDFLYRKNGVSFSMLQVLSKNLMKYEGSLYDAFLATKDQLRKVYHSEALCDSTLERKLLLSQIFKSN